MRINAYVARATGLGRRSADEAVREGRVLLNQQPASLGDIVSDTDEVRLDGTRLKLPAHYTTILLNKPPGYVCSRAGQGSRTIYELLPADLHHLKPIGRLDKDSSGLLLLTDDGNLANELMHPRYTKEKVYQVTIDKPLAAEDAARIEEGIPIDDYVSRLSLSSLRPATKRHWQVTMAEGRNRQIRRTFAALGYQVKTLHRISAGPYRLTGLKPGQYKIITPSNSA